MLIDQTTPVTVARLTCLARTLVIEWTDGGRSEFHYVWLRDNAREAHHANGQRTIYTATLPPRLKARRAQQLENGLIEIVWANDSQVSTFAPAWLRGHDYQNATWPTWRDQHKLWGGIFKQAIPELPYTAVTTDPNALRLWLAMIKDYGFAILRGVPLKSGAVAEVVELFGFVRETNFGRYFDVKNSVTPTKLTYTNLTVDPCTSNAYRNPAPTLQLFHCLSSSLEGGESVVVDGFMVADTLRRQALEKFILLSTIPIRFHYSDEQTSLTHETPVIRLNSRHEIEAIYFSNHAASPFYLESTQMEAYYEAYITFGQMLASPQFQFCFRLEPGDLSITDNRRVLSGRTAFSGVGQRHLQCCFAERDSLDSKLAVLSRY